MNTISHTRLEKYAKRIFVLFFILLIYKIYSHSLLIYTFGAPIKALDTDYTYWLSHFFYIPQFIIKYKWLCLSIDITVLALSISCIFAKEKRFIFVILLFVFFLLQRITVESYSCTHTKSIVFFFIAILPFCWRKIENSVLLIEFGRYFILFVMTISAFHKVYYGSIFYSENLSNLLIVQHLDLAILQPNHISYKISTYLICHPEQANFLFKILFLTQAIFIIGFFTKRYDRILFFILVGFAVSTFLIMRINYFDILILGLSLLYFPVGKKSG